MERGDKLEDFLEEDMSWQYEKYILEFYQRERKEITASAPHLELAYDDVHDYQLLVMKTDKILRKDNCYLIVDAKYYTKSFYRSIKELRRFIHRICIRSIHMLKISRQRRIKVMAVQPQVCFCMLKLTSR